MTPREAPTIKARFSMSASMTDNTAFPDPLARWTSRFGTPEYLFGEEPNAYLKAQTSLLHPGSVLSVADGEGRNSVWLARHGHAVTAFDFCQPAVEKAQRLAQKHHVQIQAVCSDWQSFAWMPERYDNVVGIFFQFVDPVSRAELFRRMDAVLKPGGTLILQGYGIGQLTYNTGGPGKLEHLYTQDLLRTSFSNYDVLDCRDYDADIQEGTGHQGMSALVGFTARKR